MLKIAILLSVVTLCLSYINSYSADEATQASEISLSVNPVFQPPELTSELTEAEVYWLALAKEKELALEPATTDNNISSQELVIGTTKFFFYGVFLNEKNPFILVKLDTGNMKQMYIGDTLANNAKLTAIAPTNIDFILNEQAITFNLFERKKDDKNE